MHLPFNWEWDKVFCSASTVLLRVTPWLALCSRSLLGLGYRPLLHLTFYIFAFLNILSIVWLWVEFGFKKYSSQLYNLRSRWVHAGLSESESLVQISADIKISVL